MNSALSSASPRLRVKLTVSTSANQPLSIASPLPETYGNLK